MASTSLDLRIPAVASIDADTVGVGIKWFSTEIYIALPEDSIEAMHVAERLADAFADLAADTNDKERRKGLIP